MWTCHTSLGALLSSKAKATVVFHSPSKTTSCQGSQRPWTWSGVSRVSAVSRDMDGRTCLKIKELFLFPVCAEGKTGQTSRGKSVEEARTSSQCELQPFKFHSL